MGRGSTPIAYAGLCGIFQRFSPVNNRQDLLVTLHALPVSLITLKASGGQVQTPKPFRVLTPVSGAVSQLRSPIF